MLQLGVLGQKRAWEERTARTYQVNAEWLESQIKQLPFTLTQAQKRAIQDVVDDLAEGHPMNRLLQGDVGSGKTIIAAMAAAMMAQHGVQTALMAPTSILAEQHYKNLVRLFSQENPADEVEEEGVIQPVMQADQIRLMIGATPEAEKRQIRDGLADGTIKLIIGTHALIEDPVTFADLQLTIVDEQHRFGVQQRAALRSKGDNPHLMVMTATPIPRSLALTVYGDLDLSILDEMPPGRQPVQTQVFLPRERERAYSLIRSQLELGHQAFIIYPLVEESENSESKAAVEEHTRLQENIFPKYKLGLLHGRMSADDKDEVMSRFRDCQLDILVSTSVVEVGVDVPNATVMLIEGANRFGLAQLHQFRGRVGRGQDQAYCILIPETADAAENERLAAMVETNDGFILAERDLEQRGPGDFLGTRQSGYQTELRLASLTDIHIIDKARRLAQEIFGKDPKLEAPEHQLVAGALGRFWGEGQGDIS
jgi:ATP-dependent DNA helicase RecG